MTSALGDQVLTITLMVWFLNLTGSAALLGLFMSTESLPIMLLGVATGVLVDSSNHKRLLILSSIAGAGAALSFGAIESTGTLWLAYVAGFLVAAANQLIATVTFAIVPQLVGEQNLIPINSFTSTTRTAVSILGPVLGGYLFQAVGPHAVFLLDALSFGILAILTVFVPIPSLSAEWINWQVIGSSKRFAGALRDGMRRALELPLVRKIALFQVAALLVGGAFNVLVVVFVTKVLGQDAQVLGFLLSALAVGSTFGAIALSALDRCFSLPQMIGLGLVVSGAAVVMIANTTIIWGIAMEIAFMGGGLTLYNLGASTLYQKHIGIQFRGRINSFIRSAVTGASLLSMGIGGVLAEQFFVPLLIAAIGILWTGLGVILVEPWRIQRLHRMR